MSETTVDRLEASVTGAGRRQRSDGQRSRAAILKAAAELATVEGLDGLSIGHLADRIGMSKSGLYAHFGSKEELQLATIEAAERTFDEDVIEHGLTAPPGRARLLALCDAFLSHLDRQVFPGGCFFASVSAELKMRPGPVQERVIQYLGKWLELIEQLVREGQELGEIDPQVDSGQIAFEVSSALLMAHSTFPLTGDREVLERAREAVRARTSSSPAA
jgi:AcrR family transcriptional regulator